jgi:hypothetical protein
MERWIKAWLGLIDSLFNIITLTKYCPNYRLQYVIYKNRLKSKNIINDIDMSAISVEHYNQLKELIKNNKNCLSISNNIKLHTLIFKNKIIVVRYNKKKSLIEKVEGVINGNS